MFIPKPLSSETTFQGQLYKANTRRDDIVIGHDEYDTPVIIVELERMDGCAKHIAKANKKGQPQ